MTRKHVFEGVHNFRDFGGYSAGGRTMKRGRFFRSASHGAATDDDLTRIADLGLAAIVDLRRPAERERDPSRRWTNFAATVVENDSNDEGPESWHDLMQSLNLNATEIRAYLDRFYARGPHVPRHVDLFGRYFDTLAKTDGPILVHCAAGKDRTGMIVALTHTLAGVHKDDIYADYLATNDPERFATAAPLWADRMREEFGSAPELEALHVALGVEPAWLDAAFKSIEEKHGDVETYMRDVLGVDAQKRAAIERRLFED